jgi:hypothetical protein
MDFCTKKGHQSCNDLQTKYPDPQYNPPKAHQLNIQIHKLLADAFQISNKCVQEDSPH